MAEPHASAGRQQRTAAALDLGVSALLAVWEAAREGAGSHLSGSQLRAVMVVEQEDGINLRRLSDRLGMLISSASRLCDRLVAAGMLERTPGLNDRREIALHLTPDAARLLDELRADRQRRLAAVLELMSPVGRAALLHGLAEFEAAARSAPGGAPPVDWGRAEQTVVEEPQAGHARVDHARTAQTIPYDRVEPPTQRSA